jgi:two-component system chemotaxis response regulator CheY
MGKEMKILVVEDFIDMRKLIRAFLKMEGYENVVEAEDGVSALRMIKSQKIDFIISDWNMPKMTGEELLKVVRADAEISATPFLMVTAETLQVNVINALKAGVSDYIVKPFTAKVLCAKIAKITEKTS